MKKILIYTNDEAKAAGLKAVCTEKNMELVRIGWDDLTVSLNDIVGENKNTAPAEKLPFLYNQPEVLLMSGLEQEEIFAFISDCRNKGIALPALKASVTPFNVGWSVYRLTKELQKEHEMMQNKK